MYYSNSFVSKDWYEAMNFCGANGRTLCDASTLCTGTECSYDATYQWTNEECPCT
jgi:hypothetical protein